MGKEQDWKNLGEQILDSVASALNTGDFRELQDLVSGTVNNAVQEAKRQAEVEKLTREQILRQYQSQSAANREKWMQQQQELYRRKEERREMWRQTRAAQQGNYNPNGNGQARTLPPPPKFRGVKFKKAGSASSVLKIVFGSLGIGVGSAMSIIALMLIVSGNAWFPFTLVTAIVLAISGNMLGKGIKHRKLIEQAMRYVQICGSKMYADLSEIAMATGSTVKEVKRNVKKMLRAGMFPEGHLDHQETCLMLSNDVYRQYTETAEAFRMRDQMEADKKARENRALSAEEEAAFQQQKQESELDALMREGMGYVTRLRELNDMIPGEEITEQLSQMESLLRQIFDRVKIHPEQMHRMQKLMEYYLPTTIKLVDAYVQFEKVENPGQDISDAKAEIKKTLGIINEAFSELLNNLFQDEVFDATTDAQVLQAMLSREGLRKDMGLSATAQEQEENEPEEEEEGALDDNPFSQAFEPEQSPELSVLKAPWES